MCSRPKTPRIPPPPPPPPPPPKSVDADVIAARNKEKRRTKAARGHSSTILTGTSGLTEEATTSKKTLLGK